MRQKALKTLSVQLLALKNDWEEEKWTGGRKDPLWRCGFGQTSPILTIKPPKTHTYYYYYYKALSLHLFLAVCGGSTQTYPTHFSRATLRLLEKDVVYNWIGLLRTYTRLTSPYISAHWLNQLYNFLWDAEKQSGLFILECVFRNQGERTAGSPCSASFPF